MVNIQDLESFVARAEKGSIDAAEFVDNAQWTIDCFKKLLTLHKLSRAWKYAVDYDKIPSADDQELSEDLLDMQEYAGYDEGNIVSEILSELEELNDDR